MIQTKKKKNSSKSNYKEKNPMKLLRQMDSDTGGNGSRKVVMMKVNNVRRKRLRIRGLKFTCQSTRVSGDGAVKKKEHRRDEEETEMVLSLSLSISSASDHSSENYDVSPGFEEKNCGNDDEESITCVSHGMVSVIGMRKEMEDRVRVVEGFMKKGGKRFDFFAVYDGHGGSQVAEACKERLHRVLAETVTNNQESYNKGDEILWERVMESCFEKMDEEVNRERLREEMVGSTAVVAVVGKEELVVANCGDSRAVLSRGGVAVPLSVDHKPDRLDELQRVEAAGGRVINWNGPRVLGVLATSRSIGDQYLKPFVISKPEVMVSQRTDSDEFLILASDGLWDVVSNEIACQVVRRCFIRHLKWASALENRATRAAAALVELAMARGSCDNISVVVIELKKPTSAFTG